MIRTRFNDFRTLAQTLTRAAAVLVIASCASTQSPDGAATPPAAPAAPSATVSTAPDATGIVTYDGYQAAVARSGDTVASVARRIGMSASELGAYNGLSPTHPLRPGDEMVLPPRSGGYSAGGPAAVPLDTGAAAGATDSGAADPAASNGVGWSPDLVAAAIDRASGEIASPQLRQYQTPAPEPLGTLASEPLPVETITTSEEQVVENNATVDWATTAPEPSVAFKLIRPVVGPVVIGFNQGAGPVRNDGTDFASPAGAPVVAAASGEVALVSQSLGGLGTIVLLRHPGDYLTVYGRIEKVTVGKGDFVSQGQKIGVVSPSTQPRMHFEVRHGAESMDPVKFF
ncbi:MAG: M23 family metallopeptidase [Limibaculum sp.]